MTGDLEPSHSFGNRAMHTAISCASCTRPLRIPSELLGQAVRCPFCTDSFTAVADPNIKLEEASLNRTAASTEAPVREPGVVALLESEPEPPVIEESFTVDLDGPVKVEPPKPWSTWVFVRSDSDRRLWGEMQAEISGEGLRLVRGRKELSVPVGCEATWVGGGLVRVVVGSRTVAFQINKRHVYKRRLAAAVARYLNGDRPMPINKGYGWPWYQWLMLLAPLGLLGVLIAGELPETDLKPLKGCAIFMFAVLGPVLAYALWHIERLPVVARWTAASLLVVGAYALSGTMYWFGPRLPPAMDTANWNTFAPSEGGYSINMPGPTLTGSETSGGYTFVKSAARVKPNQTFIVAYTNLIGSTQPEWAQRNAFDSGITYAHLLFPNTSYYNYKPDQVISLEEYPGKELSYESGSGRKRVTVTVRLYIVDRRLYVVLATSGYDSYGLTTTNSQKFLDSFRIETPSRTDLPTPLPMAGLLAYWSFDEGRGDVKEEKTGRTTRLGDCNWVSGVRGKAIEMNGQPNSHFVYSSNVLSFNFADQAAFTYAGWFKTRKADGVLVSQRNRNDRLAILKIAIEQGRLTAEVHQDGKIGRPAVVSSDTSVHDGKWHHFTLERENGGVTLWLDGTQQGANVEVGGQGPITTNLCSFGCDPIELQPFNMSPFVGSLDEICIFSRGLSHEEIMQLAGKKADRIDRLHKAVGKYG